MMKSAFGKRKGRVIQVDDEEESGATDVRHSKDNDSTVVTGIPTNSSRKGFKKSSLRQSTVLDDLAQDENDSGASGEGKGYNRSQNKSTLGRSSSLAKKKKASSSRLSFGPGEIISGDAAEALEDDEAFTPKKSTLGRRVIEGNTLRKNLPYQGLHVRSGDGDEERPTYSKDYLNELKSSTPATPKDLHALHATAEDEDCLDASELDGAMVVDTGDTLGPSSVVPSHIPTEAEIREKKERRARRVQEKDFISFDDADNDSRREMSLLPRKKPAEGRLVREDEDLGEGFDEFVEDGRIALGRKQEREAKRRHRKEIAAMIQNAEGSSADDTDDSEAERLEAYEAAQTRAGMDGLHKPSDDIEATAAQVPSKITPLPALSECLERLQATLSSMQQELAQKQKKAADLQLEKTQISARETEVQELLKQAGSRFAALKSDSTEAVTDLNSVAEASKHGLTGSMIVDRGLESFGNTPTVRPGVEDVG